MRRWVYTSASSLRRRYMFGAIHADYVASDSPSFVVIHPVFKRAKVLTPSLYEGIRLGTYEGDEAAIECLDAKNRT